MEELELGSAVSRLRQGRLRIAIVGANIRAASILRLLNEVENLQVAAVADPSKAAPGIRLAEELGIFATTRPHRALPGRRTSTSSSTCPRTPSVHAQLASQKPASVELLGSRGSEMVWDLLIAKKRGEEQEKLFVELQVAYDKIRSHERRLQSSKEALERANEELESRLAEIFFTHEFFKALTSFSSVDDVTSLIVDGANGILGAEISLRVPVRPRPTGRCGCAAARAAREEAFVPARPRLRDDPRPRVHARRRRAGGRRRRRTTRRRRGRYIADEIRSQAALPLRTGETIVGVLAIASASCRELIELGARAPAGHRQPELARAAERAAARGTRAAVGDRPADRAVQPRLLPAAARGGDRARAAVRAARCR